MIHWVEAECPLGVNLWGAQGIHPVLNSGGHALYRKKVTIPHSYFAISMLVPGLSLSMTGGGSVFRRFDSGGLQLGS